MKHNANPNIISSNHQALYTITQAVAVPKSFSMKVAAAIETANANKSINANFEDEKKRYKLFKGY